MSSADTFIREYADEPPVFIAVNKLRTKYLWLKEKINATIYNTPKLKKHIEEYDNKKKEERKEYLRMKIREGDKS